MNPKSELKGLLKYPGSRNWYFRFTDSEGLRRTISLGTDDLPTALQKKRQILGGEQLLVQTRKAFGAKPIGIYKVIDDYLTASQERRKKPRRPDTAKRKGYVLKKFVKDQGIDLVQQITRGSLDGWLDGLKKEGRSDDTLHTYARDLHTFVAYLCKLKLVRADLLSDFEIPERGAVGRKNWLKNGECNRVIGEAEDPSLKFILFCGFHAGLRRNEICNAKVSWFDLGAGLIHVQNDPGSGFVLKDRENRTVQLSSSFKEFLSGYLKGRGQSEYVLKPHKSQGRNRYRYDFVRPFTTHIKKCGVVCSIHDTRRSFASNLVSQGESIYIVAKWLGDGVEVVERSYGHLAPSAGNINRLTAKVA
jgi:integrase